MGHRAPPAPTPRRIRNEHRPRLCRQTGSRHTATAQHHWRQHMGGAERHLLHRAGRPLGRAPADVLHPHIRHEHKRLQPAVRHRRLLRLHHRAQAEAPRLRRTGSSGVPAHQQQTPRPAAVLQQRLSAARTAHSRHHGNRRSRVESAQSRIPQRLRLQARRSDSLRAVPAGPRTALAICRCRRHRAPSQADGNRRPNQCRHTLPPHRAHSLGNAGRNPLPLRDAISELHHAFIRHHKNKYIRKWIINSFANASANAWGVIQPTSTPSWKACR